MKNAKCSMQNEKCGAGHSANLHFAFLILDFAFFCPLRALSVWVVNMTFGLPGEE
jgi:hypothetical protein